MMGHREKLNGDGFDALARFWRRNIFHRPGEITRIKRRYSKRARRAGRLTTKKEAHA